jgi:oxygen-independent coproporphyrinogen-3 oxidase
MKYWRRAAYLGLGLDAHSMLRTKTGAAMRFATTDELDPFLKAAGWDGARTLAREEEFEEAWFLGLRPNEGVNLTALRTEFGSVAVRELEPVLTELECEELITWEGEQVALTKRGQLMSNEVFERFLAEAAVA